MCFVNECKGYVSFANVFNNAYVLCFLLINSCIGTDMQPISCCLFLSTLQNKAFVTCVISVSFVFSSDLFIFSTGTYTSCNFFFFCQFVLKSVFGNDPKSFDTFLSPDYELNSITDDFFFFCKHGFGIK